MRTTFRIALALLGVVVGWSAIQHWVGEPELVRHYQEVGLGETGRFAIASLQTAAGLGLLVPVTQSGTAVIFASIMIAIATRNAMSAVPLKALLPALLALWAVLPAVALLVLPRHRARSEAQ